MIAAATYQEHLARLQTRSDQGPQAWPQLLAETILRLADQAGCLSVTLKKETEEARVGAHLRMAEARLRNAEMDRDGQVGYYLLAGNALKDSVLRHYELADRKPADLFSQRLNKAQKLMHGAVAESQLRHFEEGRLSMGDAENIKDFLDDIRDRFGAGGIPVNPGGKLEKRLIRAGARAEITGLRSRLDYFAKTDIPLLSHITPHQTPHQVVADLIEAVARHGLKSELLFEVHRVGKKLLRQYWVPVRPAPQAKPAQILTFPTSSRLSSP